jgi:hypothetical protein
VLRGQNVVFKATLGLVYGCMLLAELVDTLLHIDSSSDGDVEAILARSVVSDKLYIH